MHVRARPALHVEESSGIVPDPLRGIFTLTCAGHKGDRWSLGFSESRDERGNRTAIAMEEAVKERRGAE